MTGWRAGGLLMGRRGGQVTEDISTIHEREPVGPGILGETFRRKKCLHIPDLSTCAFHAPSDLRGDGHPTPDGWERGRAVSTPVLTGAGDVAAVLLLGRRAGDFGGDEVEFAAWFAVLLGQASALALYCT
jgi:hypothetical protein